MIHHDTTPMSENAKPTILFELDYGQLLREQLEFEKQRATSQAPRTVAHFTSPDVNDLSFAKEDVAYHMRKLGMDVIPVCGDELADIEGVGELGLILDHQSEVDTEEFEELVDEIKLCLHQLGWNYDGWVGEDVKTHTVD